jgi:hypothetical protein
MNDFQTVMTPKINHQQRNMRHDVYLWCIAGKMTIMVTGPCMFGHILRPSETACPVNQSTLFGLMVYQIRINQFSKTRCHPMMFNQRGVISICDNNYLFDGVNVFGIKVASKRIRACGRPHFWNPIFQTRTALFPRI